MKKVATIIWYTVISVVILLSICVCYLKLIKKENMIFIGNYGLAVILSGSMEPTLSIDDLVIVKKSKSYDIDDIVVYDENDSLVVHRVVDKLKNKVITKGDANNANDMPIKRNNIKGKVVKTYSNIGKYILNFSNPVYISLIIIIVTMFSMLFKKHA